MSLLISNFNNPTLNLTLSVFKDENESVFFPAADFARKLGYENPQWAVNTHVSDEYKIRYEDIQRGARFAHPLRIQPHTQFLTEEGGYQLALRSKLPLAREFQKWVFEILKSIRQTGAYHLPGALPKFRAITDHDFELILADEQQTKEMRNEMDTKRDLIKDQKMAALGKIGGGVSQQRRRDMKTKIEELKDENERLFDENDRLFEANEVLSEETARLTYNESRLLDKIWRLENELDEVWDLAYDQADLIEDQNEIIKDFESDDDTKDPTKPENVPLPTPNEEGL